MIELEQMREVHLLQDRIQLLGSVPPGQVGNVRSPRTRYPKWHGLNLGLAGPESRTDLPLDILNRSIWLQHYRGGVNGSVYCQHKGWRSARSPARGHDRIRASRRRR